ncbi:hypothetical protein CKA32_001794 [Geitlerinema sp. FC II]|nr:hypothetical protein CKA32_001794 [Geitlerinema sp. FC II]
MMFPFDSATGVSEAGCGAGWVGLSDFSGVAAVPWGGTTFNGELFG